MTLVVTGNRNSNPVPDPDAGPNARARAGAREGLECNPPVGAVDTDPGWWSKVRSADPLRGVPKSIGALVDDTARGGAIPGDHEWWWEAPGYVWRCVVSIPLTVTLLPLVWVAQSGRRVTGAVVVYGTLRWGGIDVMAGGWWSLLDLWVLLVLVSAGLVVAKRPQHRRRRRDDDAPFPRKEVA